jgi:hypothetical protein
MILNTVDSLSHILPSQKYHLYLKYLSASLKFSPLCMALNFDVENRSPLLLLPFSMPAVKNSLKEGTQMSPGTQILRAASGEPELGQQHFSA